MEVKLIKIRRLIRRVWWNLFKQRPVCGQCKHFNPMSYGVLHRCSHELGSPNARSTRPAPIGFDGGTCFYSDKNTIIKPDFQEADNG